MPDLYLLQCGSGKRSLDKQEEERDPVHMYVLVPGNEGRRLLRQMEGAP